MIRLSREQSRSLEDWLLSRKSVIASERIDRNKLAADAAKVLGFEVNTRHVSRAAVTVGVVMPTKSSPRGVRGPKRTPIMLASILAELLQRLGEPIPPELAAYIASKESK